MLAGEKSAYDKGVLTRDLPDHKGGWNRSLTVAATTDLGDLDVLSEVSGVGNYEQALSRSVEKTAFDMCIHVLSIDGLIASKKAAGRMKDRNHILEFEELKKMLEDNS